MRLLSFVAVCFAVITSCNKIPGAGHHYDSLTKVFEDSTYQLTGVAVSATERLFINYPLWSDKYKYAVIEAFKTGEKGNDSSSLYDNKSPYPDVTYNSWKPGDDGNTKWVCVQSVVTDDNDNLWVVDPAAPMMKTVYNGSQKLVRINLADNSIAQSYSLKGITSDTGYINDVRIDTKKQYAYLTNSEEGGIVVVNLATGNAKQVLHQHY